MHSTRRTTALAAGSLLILTMTGCTVGGSGADGGSGGSSTSDTACIADKTWVLDVDDLAAQLGEQLSSNGMDVISTSGEGRQTFRFDQSGEGSAAIDVSVTVTIDSDGLVMTMVQTHSGEAAGEWAWVGDSNVITFEDWNNDDYEIQTTVILDGRSVDVPIELPSASLGDLDMEIECSPTSLSTHMQGIPYTQHWTPEP